MTPRKEIVRAVKFWTAALTKGYSSTPKSGAETAQTVVMERLGIVGRNTFKRYLDVAIALGMDVPQWGSALSQEQEAQIRLRYGVPESAGGRILKSIRQIRREVPKVPPVTSPAAARSGRSTASVVERSPDRTTPSMEELVTKVPGLLRRKPLLLAEMAMKLGVGEDVAYVAFGKAQAAGTTVVKRGELYHLDDAPPLGGDRKLAFTTDKDGWFEFAACSDEHLGSKYERLDCLHDYYDQIERRGITTVLNAGNWIDGEASFNRHDLLVHGMDAQMQYLAKNYPKRQGVDIYAVTGADHEGWYARREGIDVGKYAENAMREAGRTDWHDLGYMEAFVKIQHKETGKSSNICVMHPGGGSSYAVSYAPQKIVEGFDGGDKPAVLLIGHYHKSGYNLIRNCHTMQTGTFMGQSVFMRQKKLSAHVGGCFVKIHVDPRTGAVDECAYTFRNYFNRDYYNGQWSQHGSVNPAKRSWKAEG